LSDTRGNDRGARCRCRAWLALEPWTIENGLITQTLKITRQELETPFAREIAQLYQPTPVTRSPG
jgi:long-subunit acyl-CoA synthetase (AMP-forming)